MSPDPNPEGYEHEIIEFPIVLVDAATLKVLDTLQIYVKPTDKPKLSAFCTQLTGITQEQVDKGVSLGDALFKVHEWLRSHDLVSGSFDSHVQKTGKISGKVGDFKYKFVFATDGPWDLQKFLNPECQRKKIPRPKYFDMWANIRYHFAEFHGKRRGNINKMLDHYGLQFEGKAHSGLDDSKNIARIAICLAREGCQLDINDGIRVKRYSRPRGGRGRRRAQKPSSSSQGKPSSSSQSPPSSARATRGAGGSAWEKSAAAAAASSSFQRAKNSGDVDGDVDSKAGSSLSAAPVKTAQGIERELRSLEAAMQLCRGQAASKVRKRKQIYHRIKDLKKTLDSLQQSS